MAEYIAFFIILVVAFIGGASVGRISAVSYHEDMYTDNYRKCIKELPRNKDCVATGIDFKIVNKD